MDDAKEKLKENLQSQLAELEMLQSMFPNPSELKFEDSSILNKIQAYLDGKNEDKLPFIDFTLNVNVSDQTYEICVTLPQDYPEVQPDIFIRNTQISREQHAQINKACNDYIDSLDRGESCVYSIISWIQENASKYCQNTVDKPATEAKSETEVLTRLWIYSHHIYNKTKRREMLNLANQLKLTGFCLPGKPGVVCVEGVEADCQQWWQVIKSMTWQRITCRLTEECKFPATFLKFETFEELAFQTHGTRSNHADLGELKKYLEEHSLGYIFKHLFGVDNDS